MSDEGGSAKSLLTCLLGAICSLAHMYELMDDDFWRFPEAVHTPDAKQAVPPAAASTAPQWNPPPATLCIKSQCRRTGALYDVHIPLVAYLEGSMVRVVQTGASFLCRQNPRAIRKRKLKRNE
jgi:hypothetical protein